MKIQTNFDNNANYHTEQSFFARTLKRGSPKRLSCLTNALTGLSFVPSNFHHSKKGDYAQFVKDFELKYFEYKKAKWEYETTHSLWACIKSYVKTFSYDNFISKKENREKYLKLYGREDVEFENFNERFVNFLKQLPIDIRKHFTFKKFSRKTDKIGGISISQIIARKKEPKLRQEAYDVKFLKGDSQKDSVIDIVKKRNALARNLNKNSYFDYLLEKQYKIDAETFNNNLNAAYSELKPVFEKVSEEIHDGLKDVFKTERLEYYHYDYNIAAEELKILDDAIAKIGTVQLAKKIYSKMGFDLDKLINDGKLILYETKSKKRAFHMQLMPGKVSGVYANKSNNISGLLVFCHELGHAMYNLGLSQSMPFGMRKSPTKAINEAIAQIMQDVVINENVLLDIVPADILEKIRKNYRNEQLIKMEKNFAIIEFEQEMYANPNQDLAKLWQEKLKKYTGCNYAASNEWATFNYFINSPVHAHNNIRAMLMAAQIYKHLKENLGNITENRETARYLNENIFSKGASMSESKLLNEIIGK